MNRDERNRRRRERDRVRRETETPEETEARRASRREYEQKSYINSKTEGSYKCIKKRTLMKKVIQKTK